MLASSIVSNVKITSLQISVEYTGRHLIEYPVRSSVSVMVGSFSVQLRLGLHGRIARPMRGKDFDQASERGFAVFRVLKLKAKLGGFVADKMGKRERHFLRAHVSDDAVSCAHDVAATAAAACDSDSK